MLLKRLKNLWEISKLELTRNERLDNGEQLFNLKSKPQMAQIIKKKDDAINKIVYGN